VLLEVLPLAIRIRKCEALLLEWQVPPMYAVQQKQSKVETGEPLKMVT